MPRVEIPVTDIVRSGIEAGAVAAVASDATENHFVDANDGRVFLEVENQNAGAQTVEVLPNPSVGGTYDGLTIEPLVLTIPAGETWLFGPFRALTFQQDATGTMHIDPSISTDLLFRAYRLPNPGE